MTRAKRVKDVGPHALAIHISVVDENVDILTKGQRVSFEEGASGAPASSRPRMSP